MASKNVTLANSQWVGYWVWSSYREDLYVTITADAEREGNTVHFTNVNWTAVLTGSMRWTGGSSSQRYILRCYKSGVCIYTDYIYNTHSNHEGYNQTTNGTLADFDITMASATDEYTTFSLEAYDGEQWFNNTTPFQKYVASTGTYMNSTIYDDELDLEYGVATRIYLDPNDGTTDYEYPDVDFKLYYDTTPNRTLIDSQTFTDDTTLETTYDITNLISNTKYDLYMETGANVGSSVAGIPELNTNVSASIMTSPAKPVATNFAFDSSTNSATFTLTEASIGTDSLIQLSYRYRISGGTWSSWLDAGSPGNNQAELVTLTNLTAGAPYDIQVKSTNADGAESEVAEYLNAFSTGSITTTIVSISDVESTTTGKADVSVLFSISAVSDPSITYEYEYKYKKSSESTWTTATGTTNQVAEQIDLTLDQGTSYDFSIRTHIQGTGEGGYGPAATSTYTTSTYTAGYPTITYSLNDVRDTLTVRVAVNDDSERVNLYVSTADYTFPVYTENITSGYFEKTYHLVDNNGNVIDPRTSPTITIDADQIYSIYTRRSTVRLNTPWRIIGVVKLDNGTKKNILMVRTKDSNGNLTSGDLTNPFVIK